MKDGVGTPSLAARDALTLSIEFSFDPASGLFGARLENGASFNFAPNNVTGKLGANLVLLRDFVLREKKGEAPHPHTTQATFGATRDEKLIAEAIAAGKLQRVGVVNAVPKGRITLEELGL